jgi:hypothetical protein
MPNSSIKKEKMYEDCAPDWLRRGVTGPVADYLATQMQ